MKIANRIITVLLAFSMTTDLLSAEGLKSPSFTRHSVFDTMSSISEQAVAQPLSRFLHPLVTSIDGFRFSQLRIQEPLQKNPPVADHRLLMTLHRVGLGWLQDTLGYSNSGKLGISKAHELILLNLTYLLGSLSTVDILEFHEFPEGYKDRLFAAYRYSDGRKRIVVNPLGQDHLRRMVKDRAAYFLVAGELVHELIEILVEDKDQNPWSVGVDKDEPWVEGFILNLESTLFRLWFLNLFGLPPVGNHQGELVVRNFETLDKTFGAYYKANEPPDALYLQNMKEINRRPWDLPQDVDGQDMWTHRWAPLLKTQPSYAEFDLDAMSADVPRHWEWAQDRLIMELDDLKKRLNSAPQPEPGMRFSQPSMGSDKKILLSARREHAARILGGQIDAQEALRMRSILQKLESNSDPFLAQIPSVLGLYLGIDDTQRKWKPGEIARARGVSNHWVQRRLDRGMAILEDPEILDWLEMSKDWGGRVRARRIELGISKDELARRTGIHKYWIEKIENGKNTNPPLPTIISFAKGLRTNATWLILEQGNREALANERDSFGQRLARACAVVLPSTAKSAVLTGEMFRWIKSYESDKQTPNLNTLLWLAWAAGKTPGELAEGEINLIEAQGLIDSFQKANIPVSIEMRAHLRNQTTDSIHQAYVRRFNLEQPTYAEKWHATLLKEGFPFALNSLATGIITHHQPDHKGILTLAESHMDSTLIGSLPEGMIGQQLRLSERMASVWVRIEWAWDPDLHLWLPVRITPHSVRGKKEHPAYLKTLLDNHNNVLLLAAKFSPDDLATLSLAHRNITIHFRLSASGFIFLSEDKRYIFPTRCDVLGRAISGQDGVITEFKFAGEKDPLFTRVAIKKDSAEDQGRALDSHLAYDNPRLDDLANEHAPFWLEGGRVPMAAGKATAISIGTHQLRTLNANAKSAEHVKHKYGLDTFIYGNQPYRPLVGEFGVPVYLYVKARAESAMKDFSEFLNILEIRDKNDLALDRFGSFLHISRKRTLAALGHAKRLGGRLIATQLAAIAASKGASRYVSSSGNVIVVPAHIGKVLNHLLLEAGKSPGDLAAELEYASTPRERRPVPIKVRFGYYPHNDPYLYENRKFQPLETYPLQLRVGKDNEYEPVLQNPTHLPATARTTRVDA